jgi:endonuclease YncB( thermonuclease family)
MPIPYRSLAILIVALSPLLSLAATIEGKVIAIADGDTVRVLDAQHEQHKIRLSGIDAPEKKQAFGDRSKQAMASMVFGKQVTVDWSKTDRYGRIVGKIMVSSSECKQINCEKNLDAGLELIKIGLAWHYKKYEKEQKILDRQLYSQAEMNARKEKIGLWKDANPIAPWDFRHNK